MTTSKLRAKIRHNGKDIHLGYFNTKAQVDAACVAGHAALSRLEQINGAEKNYKDYVLSSLTGFIFGSLPLIWPFSTRPEIPEKAAIAYIYQPSLESNTLITIGIIIIGYVCVWILEKLSTKTV